MSGDPGIALAERREALRRRLTEQRGQIERALGPPPAATGAYPRSLTMRFLLRRPDLAARLLLGVAQRFRQ